MGVQTWGVSQKWTNNINNEYEMIKKFSSKTPTYWNKLKNFLYNQNQIFDIISSKERIKRQEDLWGVKMSEMDWKFYENQKCNPPKGYCATFVDRKWRISNKRKLDRQNRSRDENYQFERGSLLLEEMDTSSDLNYKHEDNLPKKPKYQYENVVDHTQDDIPYKYRHTREGLRSVKPDIYFVMNVLSSQFHMSQHQVEGAIVTIANELFGRKTFGEWKIYESNNVINNNTLPSMSNTRRTECYIEAMALGLLVEEIMNENVENSCIVYSNDGSSQSGVGNYVVQSLTVNGIKRTLPSFGIFRETKESLADLTKATLQILSASSGYRYTPKMILEKISFVMTDSTAHNLGVIEKVCQDMEVTNIPSTLLCNIHPLMMFQNKIKKLCQMIHDSLGKRKVSDCFLVDVDFRMESFIMKAIKCLTNFINCENSAKPWNRYSHFSDFIRPKQNMSLTLKDHRFNRVFDCCLSLLYHLDDLSAYLDKYSSIINGITILDRSFVEMEVLKPIFTAISLLGVHITRPFQTLLIDPTTTYSTLQNAFPKLYTDLTETEPADFLTTNHVCKFVSGDIFIRSLPDQCLLDELNASIKIYPIQTKK